MMCSRLSAAFLALVTIFVQGCSSPSKVEHSSKTETPGSEPIKDSYVKMVDEGGVSRMSIQSNVDRFKIVLPKEFRGTVLTASEIEEFANAMAGGNENLKSQLELQAGSLRSSGGALFAVNFKPADVVDGFADNMNVAIRGYQVDPNFDEIVASFEKQMAGASGAKVLKSKLDSKAGPITYLRSTTTEKGKDGKDVTITRYTFLIVRKGTPTQLFAISAASSAKRMGVAEPEFKRSAMSLEFF